MFLTSIIVCSTLTIQMDSSYAEAVPAEFQTLVTETVYNQRLARMHEAADGVLPEAMIQSAAASPCGECLVAFMEAYALDPLVEETLALVVSGLQHPPAYVNSANPWSISNSGSALYAQLISTFTDWCTWLPQISGDQDDGLKYIQQVGWLYYQNQAGVALVQGRNPRNETEAFSAGFDLFNNFAKERGAFMDSPASTVYVAQWLNDPRIEIQDYKKQKVSDYVSWNDFFSREITVDTKTKTIPSRPVTLPERDYVISAPTDCIVNPLTQYLVKDGQLHRQYIENPFNFDMILDIKNTPVNLSDLLGDVPANYRDQFIGGTGLSCVLMPNTYHHYHSPVTGTIVYAKELSELGTWGFEDFPNWIPPGGNVGRIGTDFGQWSNFDRGVVIIEIEYDNVTGAIPEKLKGYVASIPVGLDTIGSVVLDPNIKVGTKVQRGYTRIGSFYYGGSLNILLFSKGLVAPVIQTRMGNQIAIIDVGGLSDN